MEPLSQLIHDISALLYLLNGVFSFNATFGGGETANAVSFFIKGYFWYSVNNFFSYF